MINLKRILIATDFSSPAKIAMKYGVTLAKTFDAEVILCHVVEAAHIISQLSPTRESYFPPNLPELQAHEAKGLCQELLEEFGIDQTGRYLLPQGRPFFEIIQTARKEDVDLIVMGTHGRGAVAHMLLGSVAEKVVRKSPCPVLTVREGEHEFVLP